MEQVFRVQEATLVWVALCGEFKVVVSPFRVEEIVIGHIGNTDNQYSHFATGSMDDTRWDV